MSSQPYHVPVILPDMRKEESVRQVVDALEYLDAVANDIFNRISFRVGENRDQLIAINERINVAQAKIDRIRSSSTKATKVFCSPKFPGATKLTDYHTVFQDIDPRLQHVRKNRNPITLRLQEVTKDTIVDKTKRHRGPSLSKSTKKAREVISIEDSDVLGEGLGSLPRHLPSVSSLLLFNSTENPYRKYVLLDPLEGVKVKTRKKEEDTDEIHEAPSSILHGEQLERAPQDSTIYQPVMPDLPELEVPMSLPFLSHIADDITYEDDRGPSIAPSMANVPDLPDLAGPSITDTPVSTDSSSAPPPPPPPLSGDAGGGAPPPPPPPPPPPEPSVAMPTLPSINSDDDDDETAPPDDTGGTGDGRADLMAAIRKAGGAGKAGLKSSKDRKTARKAKKEQEEIAQSSSSPGDLLGDLSAALGRRRKAMSGRDKRDDPPPSTGGGSMMDKVAAMIPPPPQPGGGDDSDGDQEGEDW